MNWEFILPLLVGLASGFVAPLLIQLINKRNLTNQTNADVMNKIATGGEAAVSAAVQMLNELQEDNARLRAEDIALRAEIVSMRIDERAKEARMNLKIEALEQYIKLLIDTLRAHDITIPPRPDVLKESDPKIQRMK